MLCLVEHENKVYDLGASMHHLFSFNHGPILMSYTNNKGKD